jgi:hypothetical protein
MISRRGFLLSGLSLSLITPTMALSGPSPYQRTLVGKEGPIADQANSSSPP